MEGFSLPGLQSLTGGGALTPTNTAAGGTTNTGASTINFNPPASGGVTLVNNLLLAGALVGSALLIARAIK